jgi:maltooligosyltrehalose trehalohydrolase
LKPRKNRGHGTPCIELPPERFIYCISNHDQVGNRALGERLNQLVKPATYRAASALLLLVPYTPLLFMGQEWAASTPFQYFTDHHGELGRAVEQGRRREFKDAFANLAEVPSPQDRATFERSKLRWEEVSDPVHAEVLALYRELLRFRREHAEFRPPERGSWRVAVLQSEVLALRLDGRKTNWLALCDLRGGHRGALHEEITRPPAGVAWRKALSTNEARFGGSGADSWNEETASFDFAEAELLLLQSDTSAA